MIQKQIKVNIQEKEYTINFPTTGQLIDIETMKVSISKGMYSGLVATMSKSSLLSLDLIDSISTFIILIPDIKDEMKFDNILDISPIDAQELVVIYKKVYFPWFAEWLKVMKKKEEELNKLYSKEDE